MTDMKSPIEKYLAGIPAAERRALERIRRIVMKAYPAAQESTYYGLPAFTLDGLVELSLPAGITPPPFDPARIYVRCRLEAGGFDRAPLLLDGGLDEADEQWMPAPGIRRELGMELAAEEPRMLRQLDHLA